MPSSDLSVRVGVAAVGIPAIVALLYAGGWILGVAMAAAGAFGAGEFYDLAEARGVRPFRIPGVVAAGAIVLGAVAWPAYALVAPWGLGVLAALAAVSLTAALGTRLGGRDAMGAVAVTLLGALYAGVPLAFVPLLHELPVRKAWAGDMPSAWTGTVMVALPLAVSWAGDAAAYFAGSAWGKGRRRLAPAISPNKSWVGWWAGLAAAGLASLGWSAVAGVILPAAPLPGTLTMAGIGVLLGVGGQVGDLGESLFKRSAGVKDSGRLFPGHGGMLDRLDALVFALPLAYGLVSLSVRSP